MEITKEKVSLKKVLVNDDLAAKTVFDGSDVPFSMLDRAPTNIMYCGTDLVIRYVNQNAYETLERLEQHLPILASEVVGSKIDVFHKNPAHQQRILKDDRKLPLTTQIQLGPEHLELNLSAIYDDNRTYIGVMVAWSVETEKKRLENEMNRFYSMIEGAPVNMMCADHSGKIIYMNPMSLLTLKKIENSLPVKAAQVVGGSYDIFHKNPAHQRRILADPANLPYRSIIQVGPDKLDLLATPMRDSKGNYVGPMIVWSVITKKIDLLDTLTTQLGGAAEELSATAREMTKNASMTSKRSNAASAEAEEVAAGVKTVATNTEEMAASIKEIAKASSSAADISKQALRQAKETNATIEQLGVASQEIGNVIKVISSIAQQTNLLALNATIEAARAGDAGKGFAVVANEVKELAKQTAKATDDITAKIKSIQDSSTGAVSAIGMIAKVIDQLNGIAMSIAASVEEQTATTNEVARVVQESSSAVAGIVETFKEVSHAAEQNVAGASQTSESAQALLKLIENVKDLAKQI